MDKSFSFRSLEVASDRKIEVEDDSYLFFGGTAYLGLNNNSDFINLYTEGLIRYGVNNGTSRSNNVQLNVYDKAEEIAAKRFQAESALIMSSGFLAAQMAIKYFSTQGELLYAPDCHPALWLDSRPNSPLSFTDWLNFIIRYINDSLNNDFVVVSNTIDSLVPEIYDFSFFEEVHEGKNITFLLDDSHGIGILRLEGSAVVANVPKRDCFRSIIVASMAKGLGIDAGVILADNRAIEQLKNTSIYLGASPPAPAAMYTFIHAEDIYREKYAVLQHNIALFRKHTRKHNISVNNFPGFYFPDTGLFDLLKKKNIIISSFSYPLSTDPLLNRVVISSAHKEEDILTISREIDSSV
ncbi:aminotransferase class I/II-fold pyridoxal phosphate-dependent enzyme [Albibacterium bauzanense]|uniref:7-keto-8-aminopelargonate synthetase-like enzyme n=1 Tax=Albibacterium bauzanense TaxID=653929 RepID=A0A4R1LPF4_9SPHI|nr:aminotransferase class I/II-fold pyridoxal phosphate-dependent enzyme [Albibacterium bauzanense]TCK80968.1 7-keto-8-aminopelargonate synthetase-like enzyme [Albibacterium bauzanense]